MQTPQLALSPRDRMLHMLRGFVGIYRREYQDLSDAELMALYDLLASYLSELHDDCMAREKQRTAKQHRKGRAA